MSYYDVEFRLSYRTCVEASSEDEAYELAADKIDSDYDIEGCDIEKAEADEDYAIDLCDLMCR